MPTARLVFANQIRTAELVPGDCHNCPFHRSEYEDRGTDWTRYSCEADEYIDVTSADLPDNVHGHEPDDCPLRSLAGGWVQFDIATPSPDPQPGD